MKVLICGSRTWDDPLPISWVVRALRGNPASNPVVIHGGARGADALASQSAGRQSVLAIEFSADWAKHGRGAGPIRNQRMLDEGQPDVVFAFTDDLATSKGTADMVRRARAAGVPVYVVSRAS